MAQITFTLLLLTAKAHASLRCIELFEEDITAKITNARQSVESYNQPNGRTLTAIGNSLGAEAIAAIENLKKGALVIDSGSGFSIAGIELALKGIRVIAINAQNAWEFFANQVNSEAFSPKFKRIISLAIDELKITIEGTRLKKKFNGTSYYYDIDAASAKDLKILGQRLLQKLNSLHQKGLFNYFVGFSDLLLRHTSQEADLLLDHWGALFYSPNRTLLLDAYYVQS